MTLDKIEEKYPDLKDSIKKAEIEFELSFGKAQHNITAKLKEMLGSNFKEYQLKSIEQLKQYLQNQKITREVAVEFINKMEKRAKGEIQSPVLETILMYQFMGFPVNEFSKGFTNKFSTKNHSKAKGLNIGVEIPKSWSNEEADRPNIVQKFISEKGEGRATIQIIIKQIPYPDNYEPTKKEIEAFFTVNQMQEMVSSDGEFISGKEIILDNQPGGQLIFKEKIKRLDFEIDHQIVNYITIFKSRMVFLQCLVSGINTNNLDSKFNKFYPLFRQVANSLLFIDQYE